MLIGSDERGYEIKDWMVAIVLACATGLVTWGAIGNKVTGLEARTTYIETWKDSAETQLGSINGKLDLILGAQGLRYIPQGEKP